MNTWKVILATLVIFGSGVITGGLLVSYSDRAFHPPARKSAGAKNQRPGTNASDAAMIRPGRLTLPMPVPLRKDFLNRLDHELDLSPEQRERIDRIIIDGQESTKKFWQETAMDTRAKIRSELSPEQRKRFQEFFKQRNREEQHPGSLNLQPTNASSTTQTNSAQLHKSSASWILAGARSDGAVSNSSVATHSQSQ